MEVIIEEISRSHKVIGRHRYNQHSITIGRGYSNDIIISDPHVCSEHITLTQQEGQWVVMDLDTINGSFIEGSKQNIKQHVVKSGDVVSLGNSQVRILFPDHPVPESIEFSPFENIIDIARTPIALSLNILVFMAITAWTFYLSQVKEVSTTQLLVPTITATVILALWPLGVALISHFTKNEARTFSQLGIVFLFLNILWFSDIAEKLIAFNFSSTHVFNTFILILPLSLTFGLFWLNCHIGFHMSSRRRIVISAGLTTLFFGGGYLIQDSKQKEFSLLPNYQATLMAPTFKWMQGRSVEQFIIDSKELFTEARKEAQEASAPK